MTAWILWLLFGVFAPAPPPLPASRIVLRNQRGERFILEPQAPHHCVVTHEPGGLAWRCTGPTEFARVGERYTNYFWIGGGSGDGPLSGGVLGGNWEVVETR